jgi:hypothetical protein
VKRLLKNYRVKNDSKTGRAIRLNTTDSRAFSDSCTCTPSTQNNNKYAYVCGTAVSYDAGGNLSQNRAGYTYHYDYEIKIHKSSDTIVVAAFEYNALGRRIEKVITGSMSYAKIQSL